MQCYVYRSGRKPNTYLFLTQRDDFSAVPPALLRLFGLAEFSFEFDLYPDRKLLLADASQVVQHLRDNGYFLQLPAGEEKQFSA